MKSIYENLGGTYKASGDYSLPTFVLPKEEPFEIGVGTAISKTSERKSPHNLLQLFNKRHT